MMRVARLAALSLVVLGCMQSAVPETPRPASGTSSATPPTTPAVGDTSSPVTPHTSATASVFLPFGTQELEPEFYVEGEGSDIDSIAFWEADDPEETLMFVTSKAVPLVEIWQFPFVDGELPSLTHPSFGEDSQVNGITIDQASDRMFIAVSSPRSTITVFDLPSLDHVGQMMDGEVDFGEEPNLGLLDHPGGLRLYLTALETVYIRSAATGEELGRFRPTNDIETIVGDDQRQLLYIPDENDRSGVYAYTPEGEPYPRAGVPLFGAADFQSDGEGILIYQCAPDADDGRGLIVVADQRDDRTDFEVYDRLTYAHLGVLRLTDVDNTDGTASTQQPLPGYPMGLFVAVDDDTDVAGIGWHEILAATGLSCGR